MFTSSGALDPRYDDEGDLGQATGEGANLWMAHGLESHAQDVPRGKGRPDSASECTCVLR
eukprot:2073811-Pyramimonas_sp.AAC.1